MTIGTGKSSNGTALETLGRFFYIHNSSSSMFKDVKDVPDYIVDVSVHCILSLQYNIAFLLICKYVSIREIMVI